MYKQFQRQIWYINWLLWCVSNLMLPVSLINPYRGCTFLFWPIFPWYNNCVLQSKSANLRTKYHHIWTGSRHWQYLKLKSWYGRRFRIQAPQHEVQEHQHQILALSLSFINVLKLCCLMLFLLRKMQKTKNTALRKISYVISSQWEHFGA